VIFNLLLVSLDYHHIVYYYMYMLCFVRFYIVLYCQLTAFNLHHSNLLCKLTYAIKYLTDFGLVTTEGYWEVSLIDISNDL